MFSLSTADLIALSAAILGVIGNIAYVAKKSGEIEQKVMDLEKDMRADQAARQGLEGKIDGLDHRVYGLDSKITGLEVKVDNLKEGINDLKKLMQDNLRTN